MYGKKTNHGYKILTLTNSTKYWKKLVKEIPKCQNKLNQAVRDFCESSIIDIEESLNITEEEWKKLEAEEWKRLEALNIPRQRFDSFYEIYKYEAGRTLNSYGKCWPRFPKNKNNWNDIDSYKVEMGCHWSNRCIWILLDSLEPDIWEFYEGEHHSYVYSISKKQVVDILHKNQGRKYIEQIIEVNGEQECVCGFESKNDLLFEEHSIKCES